MSSKRPPVAPPEIPGYGYISVLGSGGFSDVYLYEQDRPRRKVAVKVLVADLKTHGARRRFESEANLMAQLSTHPYIVTIYQAEVTAAGHSYLAMEYCSRPSLDIRYRRAKFSVVETLTIGIQVASAVETAHRAGIAHRDIKPANILVTDYNRPALTDFGISGTMDAVQDDDAGMSIPWSPPESFAAGATDGVKVDIWALGATLYTLLAGHSPFVIPGADNSQRELISRINSTPLAKLGRPDVPTALELVLATAMSKSPASRYSSAKAFARALMRVQADMNLSVTPFEVQDDPTHEESDPDTNFESTRVRSIVWINPDSSSATPTSPTVFPTAGSASGSAAGADTAAGGSNTGKKGPFTQPPQISNIPGVAATSLGAVTGLTHNGETVPTRADFPADPAVHSDPAAHTDLDAPLGVTIPRGQDHLPSTVRRSDIAASAQYQNSLTSLPPAVPPLAVPSPALPPEAVPLLAAPLSAVPLLAAPPPVTSLADPALTSGLTPAPVPATPQRESKKRWWLGLGAGGVLVAAVVVGIVLFANGGAPKPAVSDVTNTSTPPPAVVAEATVPAVKNLTAAPSNGGAVWTWANPEPLDGDMFLWAAVSAVDSGNFKAIKDAKVFVVNNSNDQSCISVKMVRKNGTTSAETKKCFP